MLYIGISILIGVTLIALVALTDNGEKENAISEFCKLECIEHQRRVCC